MSEQAQKAVLRAQWDGGSEDIVFQYNPAEWSFEKSVQVAELAIPGLDCSLLQFVRGQSERITLEMFFDSTEDGMGATARSVTERTDKVYQLVKIEPQRHAPPVCVLLWNRRFPGSDVGPRVGNQARSAFTCIVEQVRHKYTLFTPEGVPLRAELSVTLREYKTLEKQLDELNLSSPDRTHLHVLDEGETLTSVANHYYRRASDWRFIADQNDIDDPRRVEPGRTLAIPRLDPGSSR